MYKSFLLFGLALLVIINVENVSAGEREPYQPTGQIHEWENPARNRINTESPRTNAAVPKITTDDNANANNNNASATPAISLNGDWYFHWVKHPDLRPRDFYKLDYNVSAWKKIPVPSSWQLHGYGTPHYSNVDYIFKTDPPRVMSEPPKNFTTYNERNPVGSYRREFTLPENFVGKNVFVRFDGVDAGYYLWVNGEYVGYAEDSYTAAEFNITDLVKAGKNIIAVEVYRFTDGSYLEDQDFFRFSGIFRDVTLYALPDLAITDFFVKPTLTNDYARGLLTGVITLTNYSNNETPATKISLNILDKNLSIETPKIDAGKSIILPFDFKHEFSIKSWNAEEPNLYPLILKLGVQEIETSIGFRKIEIGKQGEILVNGRETIFKGVNVHETHPDLGRAITREIIKQDMDLMKRNNVNMIRCSHYPHHRFWYEYADEIGMYIMDEANCEAHGLRMREGDITRVPEFKQMFIERTANMVHRAKNHPSVLFWSFGNEMGNGANCDAQSAWIRGFDNTRFLHHCDYQFGAQQVDMDSVMYPPISSVIAWGKQKNRRPFFLCEYAHAMGNALGNFQEYQEAFEKYPRLIGGCIWDWVDQNIRADRDPKTGKLIAAPYKGKTLGYGGQFGDFPNQGNFCDNGVITSDRKSTPKLKEMKYVFQPVAIQRIGNTEKYLFTNKYFHKTLSNAKIVVHDADDLERNILTTFAVPEIISRGTWEFILPVENATKNLYFAIEENNHKIAHVAFPATPKITPPNFANLNGKISAENKNNEIVITTESSRIVFNRETGELNKIIVNSENLLLSPVKLNMFRAPVDNDTWIRQTWAALNLSNIATKLTAPLEWKIFPEHGFVKITTFTETINSPVKFTISTTWKIFANGEIHAENLFYPASNEVVLPRLGFTFALPPRFEKIIYQGRGGWENYLDRGRSAYLGKHQLTVAEMFTNYSRPQSGGNRMDVEYMQFSAPTGETISVLAESALAPLQMSASFWTEHEIDKARTLDELPARKKVVVNVDALQCGLGGASCGPRPLPENITYNKPTALSFVIALGAKTLAEKITIANAPLITRDEESMVTLQSATPEFAIEYKIDDADEWTSYEGPFKLVSGKIMAMSVLPKNADDKMRSSDFRLQHFTPQATRSQWKIVAASSEEPETGWASNAIDGKPMTHWHSQYKNALPNYPHYLIVDMGGVREFSGFIYTPRTDSQNGLVANYRFSLSTDGENFTPIKEGNFSYHYIRKDPVLQRIEFGKTVTARYFKFEALTPVFKDHNWANCAEITIIDGQ